MTRLLVIGFALLGTVAQAQAPSQALLRDARDELTAAVKAMEESPEYQRVERMKRIVTSLVAMVETEKKKADEAKAGSK